MHETMVAQSLLSIMSDEAEKRRAKPLAAKVSCGRLYAINDEVLSFAFAAIAKGTPCEGVKLSVEHKPIQGRCRLCGRNFDVDFLAPRCPKCNADDFELLPDAPLILEEIEFQTE